MSWWIESVARADRQRQSLAVAICLLLALLGGKPAAADNGPVCDATPSCVTDLANIVDILSVGTGAFLAEAGATDLDAYCAQVPTQAHTPELR